MSIEEVYRERFPTHAFATDDLMHGLRMYPKERALRKALVQHNFRHSLSWLVYDLDSETAVLDWDDRFAPAPNIITVNRDNGHAHLFYGLETPVHNYQGASEKALRYLASIDVALTGKLGADPGYSKLISKNPLHDTWLTLYMRYELYDLDELADWVDLENFQDRRRRIPNVGYGRNCTLFEKLRRWAYRERRQPYLSEEMFLEAVRNHALAINASFEPPLPHSEVRATAKSVAQWTWRKMSPEGFIERQTRLGKKGTIKAAEKRKAKSEELRSAICETAKQCPSLTQEDIAAMFGVTRKTVNKHLNQSKSGVTAPHIR